jgi:hypothetical protein
LVKIKVKVDVKIEVKVKVEVEVKVKVKVKVKVGPLLISVGRKHEENTKPRKNISRRRRRGV